MLPGPKKEKATESKKTPPNRDLAPDAMTSSGKMSRFS